MNSSAGTVSLYRLGYAYCARGTHPFTEGRWIHMDFWQWRRNGDGPICPICHSMMRVMPHDSGRRRVWKEKNGDAV